MQDWSPQQRAEFIYRTGKFIHDRVFRLLQSRQVSRRGQSGSLGELSMPQYHLLFLVRQLGQPNMTELANRLGVAPSSVSAMVDRLADKGCLLRSHCPKDRRKVEVRLSPAVSREVATIEASIIRSFHSLVERLGPETSLKWCEVLEQVHGVLQGDEPGQKREDTACIQKREAE